MKKIRILLSLASLIYLLLCSALFFFQRDLLYFPTPSYEHKYSTLSFHNEGEVIDVVNLNKKQKKAILFFGGNSEIIAKHAAKHMADFPNHSIYLVNYRGYGKSSGFPTEQGIYSDALHIFDKIKDHHTEISVIGRSLGTGVATYLAANREIEKVVLIAPYDSIENIASSQYPAFPISLLLKDKFSSVERAHKIKAKTLIFLAEEDEMIPLNNSLQLIDKIQPSLLTVKTIKNTNHGSISRTKEYHSLVYRFMQ